MGNKFYITTAIPYVNAKPHIGHALEFIYGDVIARYHRLLNEDVLLLSGGDENALKNVQAAEKENIPVQEFVDKNNDLFQELTKKLGCEFDVWQKGSNKEYHYPSSQKLWELCEKNGDIYKKKYRGLYCVGCELFYTKDELDENGECYEHPGKKLEEVEEENYFFKLSKYQKELIDIYETDKIKVTPDFRKNEVLSFLKQPLEDISISRSNQRAKNWGVPVPGDPSQRIYVWFDALNIYQSGIGFGSDEKKYKKYWPVDLHVIGKGILRFHAIYWPAFLLSAKLELPKAIFVHEYFTVNGQKMSKTVGNVYDPIPLLEKLTKEIGSHGADALRYYCLAKVSPFQDGDFSEEKFYKSYNADLANGLGNLVSRVATLCETAGFSFKSKQKFNFDPYIIGSLKGYRFDGALYRIWDFIDHANKFVNDKKIWEQKGADLKKSLQAVIYEIQDISYHLKPFLPQTVEIIENQFKGPKIKKGKPLFPRL